MRSDSRHPARLVALCACAVLLAGVASGCTTTQEKAEVQRAKAQRILEKREQRRDGKGHNSKQADRKGSTSQ